ncbi:MAG: hypothetical protein ACLS4Z_08250 [Christensenellaceae bacterium]
MGRRFYADLSRRWSSPFLRRGGLPDPLKDFGRGRKARGESGGRNLSDQTPSFPAAPQEEKSCYEKLRENEGY